MGKAKTIRNRRGKDESQNLIIGASLDCIGKLGWSGLSFPIIAQKCKMTPANIVYHFASREKLLLALLNYISEKNWQIVGEAMRPEFNAYERLLWHFKKNLDWARGSPEQAQVLLQIFSSASHDREFSEVFKVLCERAQARILEHLMSGQREGLFHFQQKPSSVAKILHSVLIGGFVYVTSGKLYSENEKFFEKEWRYTLQDITHYKHA